MGNILSPGSSMIERQKASMKENMERQMRLMQAQQMAIGRERLNWMASGYCLLLTGAFVLNRRLGKVPEGMIPPMFILPMVMAYQYDFVHGNKSDRIRAIYHEILENEDHWFSKAERDFIQKNSTPEKKSN